MPCMRSRALSCAAVICMSGMEADPSPPSSGAEKALMHHCSVGAGRIWARTMEHCGMYWFTGNTIYIGS